MDIINFCHAGCGHLNYRVSHTNCNLKQGGQNDSCQRLRPLFENSAPGNLQNPGRGGMGAGGGGGGGGGAAPSCL